ncbi:ribose-phosphate diphosphokinase [Kineobactrum salinum]|uniref:Ribose-phosphate diphosphokinase n=1 Tax=Kineobactrum salinum TaxID=2708301 RepID=A0A6C0U1S9_9GAMM|nr:ribose-phosphate diphosphokinase [Kineobactrum salinum]QIB66070.1 ribose-phosphate diphosphokinase [Kineobactrum salinum]
MTPVVFSLCTELPLFAPLAMALGAETGAVNYRLFPDGESYLRIDSPVTGRDCVVLANLADPNAQYLPLTFLTATLRELGANTVGLVAPYLCYMRQDKRFMEGEAITSRLFAERLSEEVDWLVTVDPHLHRYRRLDEIYSIPTATVQGAPALAKWLVSQDDRLLLVGPDSESEQWVAAIADAVGQPCVIGQKVRRGDRDVTVSLPDLSAYTEHTAVIIDDVISSGQTILQTLSALQQQGIAHIDCAAVHGIFADGVDRMLYSRGIRRLITTNAIPHASNLADLTPLLREPILELITQTAADRSRRA